MTSHAELPLASSGTSSCVVQRLRTLWMDAKGNAKDNVKCAANVPRFDEIVAVGTPALGQGSEEHSSRMQCNAKRGKIC